MTAGARRVVRRDGRRGLLRGTTTSGGDRSAALLIRIWLEDGSPFLRGRMTGMDTSPGQRGAAESTVALVASRRDVVDAVRAWLDEFLGEGTTAVDGDG